MYIYRVDIFAPRQHSISYFQTEEEAMDFGNKSKRPNTIIFLLRHLIDDKYDVLKILD